jgi:hypothetical protein
MLEISKETIAILQYLLPGFIAAWVFFGLTNHEKSSQFERVIQALIFSFVVHSLLPPFKWLLELIGEKLPIRNWNLASENLSLAFLALSMGATIAVIANRDSFHKWLRDRGFSSRSGYASEWVTVLSSQTNFVVLQLIDGRRISGYPKVWPSDTDKGHFYLQHPAWLNESGEQIIQVGVEGILIKASDVHWVELLETFVKEISNEKTSR